ncbi:enoyl-CoA hydratase/isomerase family protein [Mumia sp. zg.B53]|uniref:3-hydroxyacyl-CoA dehydrogenase NAD-binding domain-containing protein n=1 Tax=Mumia sp. zg.B53 TaxID=2855449 RepID=UPI001C6EF7DD|nr:3-hydroxyacyl-CoA dehydrogenase NAD-binding domain-containing protein [Mumia sp. zg.B53]MBW9214352.1 enoyl-CoA hydratase/isomerase family protein [Mumia sp. zg.B53]
MTENATTTAAEAVRYERGEDGIVTLVLDDPTQSANTMNEAYQASMKAAVDRLVAEKDDLTGVVVTSGKSTFFAGGDLKLMTQMTPADAPVVFESVEAMKATLRTLETLGKPVVAAINGAALGGGLEIALATHRRIAVEGRYEIGLPEVTLGLLPAGGGVTRTVRMFGLQKALMEVLLQGPRMKPQRALETGLIDQVVATQDDLVPAAKAWILANKDDAEAFTQPWDKKSYRMPGGTPSSPKLAQFLPAFPSNLRKQTKGAPFKAPRNIMSAAVEGAQVDFDTASRIESRYFVDLVTGQQFKNMTQAFFFDLNAINAGGSRPAGIEKTKATKLAILGAGMMGAGVAYVSARAGIDVVLKDISIEAAEKGKAYSTKLLDKQVEKGRLTAEKRDEILGRIHPTADYAELEGCDFVIEAVFESVELKKQVFGDLEPVVKPDALLGSNTSTLPITILADGVKRPEDFIGIHFFSPVDKMPLVEIIVGEKTSDEAIARALDYVKQIKKTPIVVNDSRGFFTSRVFGTLTMEGAEMLAEGLDPVSIERAATTKGFPAPPLAMIDEVTLTLPQKINGEAKAAAEGEGKAFPDSPAMDVINTLVDLDRKGKAAGAGFYEYPADAKKHLWSGLSQFRKEGAEIPWADMQERYTFIMAIETVRCLEEGVLRTVADANIGSIFGIGFPPVYGGALQYINGYEAADGRIGVQAFTERAQELAAAYGERFTPPALLLEKAAKDEKFV